MAEHSSLSPLALGGSSVSFTVSIIKRYGYMTEDLASNPGAML